MNLLITGGSVDDIDELLLAVRSRRRHVKVVKLPVDVATPSRQSVILDTLRNVSASAKHLLLLLPW